MRASASGLAVVLLALSSVSCASQSSATRAQSAAGRCGPSSVRCRPDLPKSLRYVTWTDYYNSVMDEAWRRNGSVVWINPPTPIRGLAAGNMASTPPAPTR